MEIKKYLVIGNPINHSLSPQIHNYWLKENNISAIYNKAKLEEGEIKDLILDIKKKKNSWVQYNSSVQKNRNTFFGQVKPRSRANAISKYYHL